MGINYDQYRLAPKQRGDKDRKATEEDPQNKTVVLSVDRLD